MLDAVTQIVVNLSSLRLATGDRGRDEGQKQVLLRLLEGEFGSFIGGIYGIQGSEGIRLRVFFGGVGFASRCRAFGFI